MIIELKNVGLEYSESKFKLENISFELNRNESIAIVGKNGSGKSSILKAIALLNPIKSGEIKYKDISLNNLSNEKLQKIRKKISYIFQDYNLLENKTVYYNLSLVYKLNKTKVDEQEIDTTLNFFNLLKHKYSLCSDLSGGEKQKVAIAISLLQKGDVLLCDEISASLDSVSEIEIFNFLKKLKENKNISIIFISHNLFLVKNYADKIIFLEDGKIVEVQKNIQNSITNSNYSYIEYAKRFVCND